MNDLKEILVDIKNALLNIKDELKRANNLKEVELGITTETLYKAELYSEKVRKMERK